MKLHDDQELLSVLAIDRTDSQQRQVSRSLPPWQFAETVRIAIHRKRGQGCSAWFDESSKTPSATTAEKKALAYIDYGPEMQFSKRRKFWRRHANQMLAIWWRMTLRGTRHVPYSVD